MLTVASWPISASRSPTSMYGIVRLSLSSSRINASHCTWLLQPYAPSSMRTRPRYVVMPPSLLIDFDTIFEVVSGAA